MSLPARPRPSHLPLAPPPRLFLPSFSLLPCLWPAPSSSSEIPGQLLRPQKQRVKSSHDETSPSARRGYVMGEHPQKDR